MKTAELIKSERFSGYRILVLAIIFSFAWHIFWLSMIKVVAAPVQPSQVRFSKVSFLGQILANVALEVTAPVTARTFLEKRYLAVYGRPNQKTVESPLAQVVKYEGQDGALTEADGKMVYLVDDAVSRAKVEPDYGAD